MKTKLKNSTNKPIIKITKKRKSIKEDIITQALINARKTSGLTQKQLPIKTGINQSDISKIENGNANPSIRTLKRLSDAMDMKLKVEFIPA